MGNELHTLVVMIETISNNARVTSLDWGGGNRKSHTLVFLSFLLALWHVGSEFPN